MACSLLVRNSFSSVRQHGLSHLAQRHRPTVHGVARKRERDKENEGGERGGASKTAAAVTATAFKLEGRVTDRRSRPHRPFRYHTYDAVTGSRQRLLPWLTGDSHADYRLSRLVNVFFLRPFRLPLNKLKPALPVVPMRLLRFSFTCSLFRDHCATTRCVLAHRLPSRPVSWPAVCLEVCLCWRAEPDRWAVPCLSDVIGGYLRGALLLIAVFIRLEEERKS